MQRLNSYMVIARLVRTTRQTIMKGNAKSVNMNISSIRTLMQGINGNGAALRRVTMTLEELQFYAELTQRFFENNPDLCPHDFHWIQTDTDGTKIFRCSVCGKKEQTKGDYP